MRISFECPATAAPIALDLKDDRQTVLEGWNRPVRVNCPHCGGLHMTRYRDVYVEGVLSGLAGDFERILGTGARPAPK